MVKNEQAMSPVQAVAINHDDLMYRRIQVQHVAHALCNLLFLIQGLGRQGLRESMVASSAGARTPLCRLHRFPGRAGELLVLSSPAR